jgi:hypothetical protein
MDSRPAVGAIADIGRNAVLAGESDQRRREAVTVERAVGDRGQPYDRRPHTLVGQLDDEVLGIDAVAAGHDVGLQADAAQVEPAEQRRTGRADERLVGSGERIGDCPQRGEIALRGAGEIAGLHRVVPERKMDDSLGGPGRGVQSVDVVEVAAHNVGTPVGEAVGGIVGTGQSDDGMPVAEQFGEQSGADVTGGSGDEDTHDKTSRDVTG